MNSGNKLFSTIVILLLAAGCNPTIGVSGDAPAGPAEQANVPDIQLADVLKAPPMRPGDEFQPGDANADGRVDLYDLRLMIQVVTGQASANAITGNADVDGNGTLEERDAYALLGR